MHNSKILLSTCKLVCEYQNNLYPLESVLSVVTDGRNVLLDVGNSVLAHLNVTYCRI